MFIRIEKLSKENTKGTFLTDEIKKGEANNVVFGQLGDNDQKVVSKAYDDLIIKISQRRYLTF